MGTCELFFAITLHPKQRLARKRLPTWGGWLINLKKYLCTQPVPRAMSNLGRQGGHGSRFTAEQKSRPGSGSQ